MTDISKNAELQQPCITAVISRYLCDECGWVGTRADMKNEQDIDYDQDCCPNCNNVMFDDGHGYVYCEKV